MCRSLASWIAGGLSAAALALGASSAFAAQPETSSSDAGPARQAAAAPRVDDPQGILNLDIDQLAKVDVVAPSLNMEVSTVERTESTVGRTPAAVFVITNEMIRRSGARTIPDVLRLAPGVEVRQKTANEWAVSIRGFNGTWSDKLLVQIDGRQVYTPLFGGVFWDVQDLVFEDIERIEVIRGPGGTLWGANAVNGVINIITKGSKETQGGYFQGAAGTEERGMATARYGGQLGDNATYRVYGKWFERDGGYIPGQEPFDDYRQAHTGFRIDWTPQPADAFTLQGDYYNGESGAAGTIPSPSPPFSSSYEQDNHVFGGNVLGRWTHVLDKDSDWSFQWYYDRAERHDQVLPLMLDMAVVDLDFQYRFPLADTHALICGLGYRNYADHTRGIPYALEFDPADRTDDLYSCFLQDQITLRQDLLYFILGSKFEHNNYTGFEMQPTARLLWTPDDKRSLWAAVSRAVQTPTRLTDNGIGMKTPGSFGGLPLFPVFYGNPNLGAVEVVSYEIGMRAQPTKRFYWDLTGFINRYRDLVGFEYGTPYLGLTTDGYPAGFFPATAASNLAGRTYGFELAAGYELNHDWNLRGAYTFLRMFADENPDESPFFVSDSSPRNQFYLWLTGDLGNHWSLDLIGRYVDDVSFMFVPHYFAGDVRLAYRPRPTLEYAVVGRNLLAGNHYEVHGADLFGVMPTEVQPEVYGTITWKF